MLPELDALRLLLEKEPEWAEDITSVAARQLKICSNIASRFIRSGIIIIAPIFLPSLPQSVAYQVRLKACGLSIRLVTGIVVPFAPGLSGHLLLADAGKYLDVALLASVFVAKHKAMGGYLQTLDAEKVASSSHFLPSNCARLAFACLADAER